MFLFLLFFLISFGHFEFFASLGIVCPFSGSLVLDVGCCRVPKFWEENIGNKF